MKEQLINTVLRSMQASLNNAQLVLLRDALHHCLANIAVAEAQEHSAPSEQLSSERLLSKFCCSVAVKMLIVASKATFSA